MQERITRLLPALAVAVALIGGSFVPSIVLAQQEEPDTTADRHPIAFKVYSKNARESFTATCIPSDRHSPVVDQVTCKFVHVRFDPPEERTGKWEQEVRKNLEQLRQEACSSQSKWRIATERQLRDPEAGPKTKSRGQRMLAACSEKDPDVFLNSLLASGQTCGLWVDHFELEFSKVKEGQWLFRSERPGLLSKVLKVYELTGNGFQWTLSETRVPTEGAKEKPIQTVWSWKNISDYELPCDFISHSKIQYQ